MSRTPRLQARRLSVAYGQHKVVHGIDFDVQGGEIVALLGANGSGKSTTVSALTGVNPATADSEISFAGRPVRVKSMTPTEARRIGIRVVHQEAPLIGNMTVAQMAALAAGFPVIGGIVREREMGRRARAMLDAFDIDIDPSTLCAELTAGERALVSLAISMAEIQVEDAVLILDEATASLSSTDAERFLQRVRAAAGRGLAVIMVTHRLAEVRDHCDRLVVLRGGVVVSETTTENFSETAVVQAMVGAEGARATTRDRAVVPPGQESRLLAADLVGPGVNGVSFAVAPGEILGITGRNGEGAAQALRLIAGLDRLSAGTVTVEGAPLKLKQPRDAIAAGVYYVSADRINEGGVPLMSVQENTVLPKIERYGLGRARPAHDTAVMNQMLLVHPSDPSVAFGSLSGGNQQKVLLARWLLLDPSVLVLDDPTAGVDPNTREVIFHTLQELVQTGTSIVLRSSEPDQLARLCDRVVVINQGVVIEELTAHRLTMEEISRATYS